MDNLSISPDATNALQNLSAKDKQELNTFVQQETQKAQIQQTVCQISSSNGCVKRC